MNQKTFIIDTNVLLHDPEAMTQFPHHRVMIPLPVLEELDKMKHLPNELGRNARAVFRFLDSLRTTEGEGNLHSGVKLTNGTVITILLECQPQKKQHLITTVSDNRIIMAALLLQEMGHTAVFVSKDFAARVKAEALGIEAEDYENLKFSYDTLSSDIDEHETSKHNIDLFFKDGGLVPSDDIPTPNHNSYMILRSPENSSAVCCYSLRSQKLEPLVTYKDIWGITPRNVEQKCAIDLLLREDIKLVALVGPAGTGKTLLALACGLKKAFDNDTYARILISRPVVPLGRDIGYLPGTKEEKLFHWMQPIHDNLEFLCSTSSHDPSDTLQWVLDSKKIELEAVTYIRGRSLPKMYIIIDEAQNLTPHEVKTIVSRAGEGTKVILTGDATQIDNPYLDKDSNGLTYAIGKFEKHPLFGQIFLNRTERSELAAAAAELL